MPHRKQIFHANKRDNAVEWGGNFRSKSIAMELMLKEGGKIH
jgi:hypothetical protein